MNTIYVDREISDTGRREELYAGQLFSYAPTPGSVAFIEFAKTLIEESFGSLDPETAQYEMSVEDFAAILGELKPKFIHHPESKTSIQHLLQEFGCDLERTYFDVPRLRTATSDDYLTSGIAYAFHPHRDTWYSAPQCQLNWWIPIYGIESGRSMAFHTRYWTQPLKNGSSTYNYDEWNKTSRFNAAKHVKTDTREQPKPEEPVQLDPQLRVVTPPGGVLIFSAAHLHSSVPNGTGKTRFSIDFRTVHLDDVEAFRGAPNVDSATRSRSVSEPLDDPFKMPPAKTSVTLGAKSEPSPRCLLGSTADQQACLAAYITGGDAPLANAFESLVKEMRRVAHTAPGAPDPATVQRVRVEQRAWMSIRDSECPRKPSAGAGPFWAQAQSTCFTEMAGARAAELHDAVRRLKRK